MDFLSSVGFRLDQIFPSDDPEVAIMSGFGMNIRLDKNVVCATTVINILTDNPNDLEEGKDELVAPNGTVYKILPKAYEMELPKTVHQFEVRKLQDNDPWVIGRAGMLYRDLIPDRLGGSIIASHIRIEKGGPVPDMVHYHTIGFQLIYCYRGWVKLVYEDQGPAFILEAGDCVIQPPEIRHRVLESGDNLEVIEIGVPASHMTTIDHELELPTKHFRPEREFGGQRFCHHIQSKATWIPWRLQGFEHRETGVNEATKTVASVQIARPLAGTTTSALSSHSSDILFTFVTEGTTVLKAENEEQKTLTKGDAFVIPPDLKYQLLNCSTDLELLEVSLPGTFETSVH